MRKPRVSRFTLEPHLLKYRSGKYFKGPVDRLRRMITSRKSPVYLYLELPQEPATILVSAGPIENEKQQGLSLIGVYDKSVSAAMLREDLPYDTRITAG